MSIMTFQEMLEAYWIEHRTLFGFECGGGSVTLRFDLYHCDDERRLAAGTEYLLDVTIAESRFRVIDGPVERLREPFSADILAAELEGDKLRIVADCSFYASRGHDIVRFLLLGGTATVTEHPPNQVVREAADGSLTS